MSRTQSFAMLAAARASFLRAAACTLALLCLAAPAAAQFKVNDLPDLSALDQALKGANAQAPEAAPGEELSSGMPVPDAGQRGFAARTLGDGLREAATEKQATAIADAMLQSRDAAETVLVQKGFATRDLGVAVAMFVVVCWEATHHTILSQEAEVAAARSLTIGLRDYADQLNLEALSDQDLDRAYDALLTMSGGYVALIMAYEQAGRPQEADALREAIGANFEKLFGFPVDYFTIDAQGVVSVAAN